MFLLNAISFYANSVRPVLEEELTTEQLEHDLVADLDLLAQAHGYCVDVKAYEDHFTQAARVKVQCW